MELILVIRLEALLDKLVGLGYDPTVDLKHIVVCDKVGIGIEIAEVCHHNTGGVSDLSVRLGKLLEDVVGATDVCVIVARCRPKTNKLCAVLLNDVVGADRVSKRLVHRLTLTVNYPTVSQNGSEGRLCLTRCANRGEKRGLEPSSVLVTALEIDVGGPAEIFSLIKHCVMGRAGIKPTVKRVGLLAKAMRLAAMRTYESLGKDLVCFHHKPSVRSLFAEELRDDIDGLVVADGLLAIVAIEYGNRQTPMTLTGNTPVGSLSDHLDHSLLSPCGKPLYRLTSLNCRILEGLDRAEPLRSCAEDDGRLTSPAVRILMLDLLGCKKRACLLHILEYCLVGYRVVHSRELACVLGLIAAVVDGNDNIYVVTAAGLIVVCAEAGCCVYASRTAIHSYVICIDYNTLSVKEGVLRGHILELRARHGCKDLVALYACRLHSLFDEGLCKNVGLAALCLYKRILLDGIERDSKVAGQSPCGSRPDDEIGIIKVADRGELALVVADLELYVNRGALIGLVLDLCLCERGLVLGAPINRLKSLVDVSLLEHLAEHPDLCRLELGGHSGIRMLPVAYKSESLELLHLSVDKALREFFAGGAELGDRHLLAVDLILLENCRLDGHTVVIPAGYVGDLVSRHRFILVDKVLDGLIEGVTHVDVSV